MKHINEEALGGCENLHTVILEGQTFLEQDCFTRCPRLTRISVLSGMAEYYKECQEEHWYYYIIEYFHHTGKEDILTPKQKKYLDDFLQEESKKNKRYKTNWEYALSMWNDNNTGKTQVDETSEVLDYTKLKD